MIARSETYKTRATLNTGIDLSDAERARRSALSVEARFPAIVRGVNASGRRFECDAVLERLGACCLGFQIRRMVQPGATLFVCISLASAPSCRAARVAMRGWVVETKPLKAASATLNESRRP